MVIARFGTVANLVTQVLEPTIGNYFRNAAQSSDVIDFLQHRKERQEEARKAIAEALGEYNVVAVDTLIGDITPPAELMQTLTDRKLAAQRKVTFATQQEAEEQRKSLEQAKAMADTQSGVVSAQREIEINDFKAQAAIKKAEGDAKAKTVNAEADATVTKVNGEAEAGKVLAIGNAEAEVIQKKTNAVGADNFAVIEVGRALAAAKVPLVPEIVAGSAGTDGSSGIVNVLMAGLLRDSRKKLPENASSSVQ